MGNEKLPGGEQMLFKTSKEIKSNIMAMAEILGMSQDVILPIIVKYGLKAIKHRITTGCIDD